MMQEIKLWLKDHLDDLDSKEFKCFKWYLHTPDESKDGFKPIKKSRLELADRLDTVDLMFQMYTTITKEVAETIFKKIIPYEGHAFKFWILNILENLDNKELKLFQWYLCKEDESKDGFKPIKRSELDGADIMGTVDVMVKTYHQNIRKVTKEILEKIENNKDKVPPEIEEQINSSTPSEENELNTMLSNFESKVSIETLTQLIEDLMSENILTSSDKDEIFKNHTRVNMATCLVDIVKENGNSQKLIDHLQTKYPQLLSDVESTSNPGQKSDEHRSSSENCSKDKEKEILRKIWPDGNDAELLKDRLDDLDSKEFKYFKWYLCTSDESKDGFKPIKKSRLEDAKRLDTVDLMFQMYTTITKEVADKIFKKIIPYEGHEFKTWLLDILEDLNNKQLTSFQWYLRNLHESKDGFKPIKRFKLVGADRLDTVDVMVKTYHPKTREVTKKILKKIEINIDEVPPEIEEQINSSTPSEEKELNTMLSNFESKVSIETLTQLIKDLMREKILTSSDKDEIFKNRTRLNMVTCLVDIVKENGNSQKLIDHLQTKHPQLLSDVESPSNPGQESDEHCSSSKIEKHSAVPEASKRSSKNFCPDWCWDFSTKKPAEPGEMPCMDCSPCFKNCLDFLRAIEERREFRSQTADSDNNKQRQKHPEELDPGQKGYLHTAEGSSILTKNDTLQGADGRDTAHPMTEPYPTNTWAVNKENELNMMLLDFVRKVAKETLKQLIENLKRANILKSSDEEAIFQNHTRVNMATCLVNIVMEKETNAYKDMIHHLQTIDPQLWSELQSSSIAGQESGEHLFDNKIPLKDMKNIWQQKSPGDSDDADALWLKERLEDLDSRELKYFHWYLYTLHESDVDFKPIVKSSLEHADRLDTVNRMFQMYSTNTKEVAEKIFKKIIPYEGHVIKIWLLDILEDLNKKELKLFQWYLHTT
ncbi:uncharacterized protein LOC122844096 [Gambusia affinis]|uniref:uncharacterized protein LOC122844096 n=1 Tax=Gambusia affinis TaxID=33528 RepID=UPI001CDB5BD5|nr:uncharacterized protein LOC122844096 [Gambusia affinis]